MTVRQQKTVQTLLEAMPYIRRFWGTTVVIKYGGAAMTSRRLQEQFAEDMVLLRLVGMKPVIVHGGGPEISRHMDRLDMKVEFIDGLRVTDAATMEVAKMVLVGKVNQDIVGLINRHGGSAVGLSGEDGRLIRAVAKEHFNADGDALDLGFVGQVHEINAGVLNLLAEEVIPVVASVGSDDSGQSYNINADTVAGAIAEALGAEKLVYLTDIEGLRRVIDDPTSLIRQTTPDELEMLMADGTIAGGMIPKVESCVNAVRSGVRRAHILDGRIAHVLLLEIFTDEGIGTMVQ